VGPRPDEVKFKIHQILPIALASNRNEYRKHKKKKNYLGSKVRLVRGADNLNVIYEPIAWTMWDAKHLTTL
jgi:hypothetical protein